MNWSSFTGTRFGCGTHAQSCVRAITIRHTHRKEAGCRSSDKGKIFILLNNQAQAAKLPAELTEGTLLWQEGLEGQTLTPMGFAVFRKVTGA